MIRTSLLILTSLVVVACATPSGSDNDEDNAGALTTGSAAASEKFEKQLFDDVAPNGEIRKYTLIGNVPGSRETCKVDIRRASLHPSENNWSTLTVTPLGRSAAAAAEHGPADIGWAYNGASHAKLAIEVDGNTVVWSETNTGDASGHDGAIWVLKGTLKFSGSDHRYDKLASVRISGTDVIGYHRDQACENLKATFELTKTEERKVEAARDQWGRDNNEDVSELEYEGCDMVSPKRLGCNFGNDTNEEQLYMLFEIVDGHVGRMVHADRTSDFH
jgi:hypothetical protein